jgi:hypothetical protein
MTFVVAVMYHFIYSMVVLQDYSVRKDRVERVYNEFRYARILGKQSVRGISRYEDQIEKQRSAPDESDVSYIAALLLSTLWMAWPLLFSAYDCFLQWGFAAIGFVVIAVVLYCISICLPAYGLLTLLKSKNEVTLLRRQEAESRATLAYQLLENQWRACDGYYICPVCSPSRYENERSKFFCRVICGAETSDHVCGRKDIEKALVRWGPDHRLPEEAMQVLRIKIMRITYSASVLLGIFLWLFLKRLSVHA